MRRTRSQQDADRTGQGAAAPATVTHEPRVDPLAELQARAGNEVVNHLINGHLQAKLLVGSVDDPAERQADRVADAVVQRLGEGLDADAAPASRGQTPIEVDTAGGEVTAARTQHGSAAGPAGGDVDGDTESRIQRAQRSGSPLSAPVRARFESGFGADLGAIRVHTGPSAAELNERVGASAFTVGSHLFFRHGLPDATSARGQHLLAHEITHAVQQGALGTARRTTGVAPSPRLQRAYQEAVVTKKAGASLHKSDRKKKAGAAAKVRSGGIFATGLKINVPHDTRLQVDFTEMSADGQYLLAKDNGTIGYVNANNVATFPTVIGQIMTGVPLAVGLGDAFARFNPLSIDLVQPYIEAASQDERDIAWMNQGLMATAKANMSLDDYLAMLPMLRVLNKPSAKADPWGTFDTQTLGPEVDNIIRTHLGAYVGGAVVTGRQVTGQISVVGDEDWKLAFERQWKKPYLQPFLTGANAFVDVNQPERHIWIHKERGSPGTAIHEGVHKYASPVLRDELINTYQGGGADVCQLDEGSTEYFTRLAIKTGTLGYARASYPDQHAAVCKLVGKVGEAVLAQAYFDGDFPALKARFEATTKNRWDDYAQALENKQYAVANGLIP